MKSLLIVSALFVSFFSSSQVVPKTRVVGGQFAFGFRNGPIGDQSFEGFDLSVRPQFGKFLTDKWLLETGVSYSYRYEKYQEIFPDFNVVRRNTNRFGANVALTRLFPISEKLYFTLRANVSSQYSNSALQDSSVPIDEFASLYAGVSPGFMFYLSPRWLISAELGALNYQGEFSWLTDHSHFVGFNFSTITSGIGFRYVLEPGKKKSEE